MANPAPSAVKSRHLAVTLLLAILSLIAWILLAFVFPLGIGYVHLLFGLGVTLLLRWFALKNL